MLITLGARFDDRVTGKLDSFAPEAKVIHIDVDPAEISKIRFADVPIVGDLKYVLPELTDLLSTEFADQLPNLTEWWNELNVIRKDYPLGYEKPNDGLGSPEYVLERISALTGPDAYYVTGVGQHQMWGAHYIQQESPRHFISSAGLGTMGYGVPAGMGAKVAHPESTVWIIDGDGCFQMTCFGAISCSPIARYSDATSFLCSS